MPRKPAQKVAPEFARVQGFISDYSLLPTQEDLDFLTVWTIGTWTFGPSSAWMPQAYPYVYLTGAKGSGKTHLGIEVLQYLCRQHKGIAQTTGATLFRLIGLYDDETHEVIPHYPTLAIDEVDAIYAGGGSNDESLRGVGNAGYKRGLTVPRSMGKTSIDFPVYCPKIWIGIDNGRLPETLTSRAVRIDIRKGTPAQLDALKEGPYSYEVEDEAAEIQQMLSNWATREALVLRDYKPARPEGIHARLWEISRPMIQLAHALGVEDRIVKALTTIFARNPAKVSGREAMYRSLARMLENNPDATEFLTRDIVAHLEGEGVQLPGRGGGKGLSAALLRDGSGEAGLIRLRGEGKPETAWDSRVTINPITNKPSFIARGYKRLQIEEAVAAFAEELNQE